MKCGLKSVAHRLEIPALGEREAQGLEPVALGQTHQPRATPVHLILTHNGSSCCGSQALGSRAQ